MKRIYLILQFAAVAVSILVASACVEDELPVTGETGIELNGVVCDSSTEDVIEGIMVLFSAYSSDDSDRTSPTHTDTCYTNSSGYYEVSTVKLDTDIYSVSAVDVDGEENGGEYESKTTEIELSENSPSYDEESDAFVLSGIVLFLDN